MVPFDLDENDVEKKKWKKKKKIFEKKNILPQLQHIYHNTHSQYTTFINQQAPRNRRLNTETRFIAWLVPVDLDMIQTWYVLKCYHINELSRDQCKINPMKPVPMPCWGLINIAFSNNTHWFNATIHMISPGAKVPCQNLTVYRYEIITRIRPGSPGPWIAFR